MNKMKKLNKIEKRILIVETIFMFGILIYLFFSTIPTQIYPFSGMTIIDPNFVFEIANGEQVILSNDLSFSNPIILNEGDDVILDPGIYYWKVKGLFRESEVKSFVIQGHVGLNLKDRLENYALENSGNVDLEIQKENQKEKLELEVGESLEIEKDNSKYEGEQK